MPERKWNVNQLADKVVTDYVEERLVDACFKVELLAKTPGIKVENVRPAVKEANSWVRWLVEDGEARKRCSYRIFEDKTRGVQVVRGKEIKP